MGTMGISKGVIDFEVEAGKLLQSDTDFSHKCELNIHEENKVKELGGTEWYSEQRTGSLEDSPTWRQVMLGVKCVLSLLTLQLIALGSLGLGNNVMGCRVTLPPGIFSLSQVRGLSDADAVLYN